MNMAERAMFRDRDCEPPMCCVRHLCAGLALLAALFSATPSDAHPHTWIYYEVELVFDEEARIAGMRQSWSFDEFYTVYATAGLGEGGKPDQKLIDAITAENMKNLREYGYFTDVRYDGERIGLDKASDIEAGMDGDRLRMSFFAPLERPVDPRAGDFSYRIFDPTFYIEMVHAPSDQAIRLSNALPTCTTRLIGPDPNPEMSAYAAALDRTQKGTDGLGALFAEKVVVRCEPFS